MRYSHKYQTIYELHDKYGYSIESMCVFLGVARSSYYKWLGRECPNSEVENEKISELVKEIHDNDPTKGYRRIKDDLFRDYGIKANDKRILRICRAIGVRSNIKYNRHGCTVNDRNPMHTAENILDRKFTADAPNEKWVTDVTEFKYYVNGEKCKIYLSVILDLFDRRVVAYEVGESNNNNLVFQTFDHAVELYPNAHPLFHSDRGFQYTNTAFHQKLMDAQMTQSMSRVGRCLDNGPMEGFWGMLKRERYYGIRFESKEQLMTMISSYIEYYNSRRYQRKLGVLTPLEKYKQYYETAA